MIEYFWITDTELSVNGQRMTPEESYKRYPNYAKEIREFVAQTHRSSDRIFNYMQSPNLSRNKTDKKVKIKEQISQIFKQLKIEESNNPKVQFKNAYLLFEYIINNSHYDESIMDEKEQETEDSLSIFDMEINDIYRCICEHRSVCTSDASALSLLYRMCGIDSKHITIGEFGDKPEGVHEVVLMTLDGKPLIGDPTLVRTAIRDGNISGLNTKVFTFSAEDFFKTLYPTREIKYVHNPISLDR